MPWHRRGPGAQRVRVALEVRVPAGIPAPATLHNVEPAWLAAGRSEGVLVGGAVLGRAGLALPVLAPGHALVVVLEAE